jgi:hypothetical protein
MVAEHQVQELEEQEELEKKLEKVCAEKITALSPEEREEMRKADEAMSLALAQWLQAFENEMEHQVWEAKVGVECARMLHLLIEQGKATDYKKAETVELLRRAESPDVKDVPDEELKLDGESMDSEVDPKQVEGTRKQKQRSVK